MHPHPHEGGKKISWLAVLLSALAIVFPALAQPADQPGGKLEKVRIAYSAISSSQLVGWIAYDAGFFRKNGLDVEFIFIEGRAIFGFHRWSW